MQDLKVGLIQTTQFWEDKESNYKHFEKLLVENFTKEVDLILLPEMFTTSFSMNVENLAESMEGQTVKWMIKQAALFNSQIAGSVIIKDEDNFFNRLLVVSADGVEAYYDKRHLFRMAGENKFFTSGEKRIVYQLKGWNILLQVCYDLRFPVFSRNKIVKDKKEYDLVIYIANWPEKRSEIWQTLLRARAIENQSFCIGLNRIGEDGKGITYSGDSAIIDPWGNYVEKLKPSYEIVKLVTLKSAILYDIADKFPAFLDAD